MKRTISMILLALMVSGAMAQKKSLISDESQVKWLGKKVGGEHYGFISLKSGVLEMKGNEVQSGTFVMDMSTITVTDLTNAEYNAKLVGHLKSDDFFGVDKFPVSTLVITSGKLKGNNVYVFKGSLTIKGKTNPVEFEAMSKAVGANTIFTGKLVVDRSLYDVRYGSGKFFDNLGDKMIYDNFELDFSVVVK
jgi:polyisoprenoid-binding protein YceI